MIAFVMMFQEIEAVAPAAAWVDNGAVAIPFDGRLASIQCPDIPDIKDVVASESQRDSVAAAVLRCGEPAALRPSIATRETRSIIQSLLVDDVSKPTKADE